MTEVSKPAGKVNLSPFIDCHDGMPAAWNVSCNPDAQLANTMPDRATRSLSQNVHLIVHSGRGCYCRWPGWIKRVGDAGLTRSISRKGCPPDNSACEGFFGRVKNEMFYGRWWPGVTLKNFMQQIESYMVWYRNTRIKLSSEGVGLVEFRTQMGGAI